VYYLFVLISWFISWKKKSFEQRVAKLRNILM